MTIKQLKNVLDDMENGKYTSFPIWRATDQIAWLWKWKKITHEEMVKMTDQAIRILENMR